MKKLVDGLVYEIVELPGGGRMESCIGTEKMIKPSVEGRSLFIRAFVFNQNFREYIKDLEVESVTVNGLEIAMVDGEVTLPATPGFYSINETIPFYIEGDNKPVDSERITQLESDNAMLMLSLAESQIKQQETDQTISELMLMMAGGQVNV